MITFDRPHILLFLPFVPSIALISYIYFKHVTGKFGLAWAHRPQIDKKYHSIKRVFALKSCLWATAFICLLIAYAGPYWGTKPKTVQTSGNTVSFVFDISYSMTAVDMPPLVARAQHCTRLVYSAEYARQLLKRFNGTPVSVVLAKGSGILAVPATEDYFTVESLLSALSPQLLSSAGSDLGEGVLTAIRSFPPQSAASPSIILFTDGDETTASLENAAAEAVRYGIHLVIVGFGSKNQTEITAGDGTTRVKTALREQNMQKIVTALPKKNANAMYINALDPGSALRILSVVQPPKNDYKNGETAAYGEEPIPRFMIFLCTALFCFIFGLIVTEFRLTEFRCKKSAKSSLISFIAACFLLTSCGANLQAPFELLTGVLLLNRKEYNGAVTSFLKAQESALAVEDATAAQYAQFALGTVYLLQNETAASAERFSAIQTNAPPQVLFGMWYNSGILAHRDGNYRLAADYFKKSLLVDSSNVHAKINLELSIQQATVQPAQGAQEMVPINEKSENNTAQDAVFSIIREKEQNQWKSQSNQNTQKNVIDY